MTEPVEHQPTIEVPQFDALILAVQLIGSAVQRMVQQPSLANVDREIALGHAAAQLAAALIANAALQQQQQAGQKIVIPNGIPRMRG